MPKILILGATRGLGLGLVREFLGRGWDVVATARNPAGAEELSVLAKESGRVQIEAADLENVASIQALQKKIPAQSLDILFVNGGIWKFRDKHLSDLTRDNVGEMFLTNSIGTVRAGDILGGGVKSDGVIAFMSSMMGSLGANFKRDDTEDLYRATKAAQNLLVRSFTHRAPDPGITVLSISPGWVRTEMGGPNANIDTETSVKGCADVAINARGTKKHGFFSYEGKELPW